MAKIYVIHENDDWTRHLVNRLEELDLPYETWHLDEGIVNLTEAPPEGVFYNRMSASSHTRDHRYAPELTGAVLDWLEFHGRKVLNGSNALRLELSKVKQYTALEKHGVKTPKTIAAVGKQQIIEAAKALDIVPFITKHNRAGKGLGVQLFYSIAALEEHLAKPEYDEPVDGIVLLQEYIESPESYITRVEFIGGQYFYSVQVDTSEGFELCPADVCQIGDLFCPVGEEPKEQRAKFEIVGNHETALLENYVTFLKNNGVDVAGIEFIRNAQGEIFTYDVNTNTNYNPDAEAKEGKFAMLQLAKFLGQELEKVKIQNVK